MPSIAFVAPTVRAAIASLQAGLPAQIAAFNAEPANTVDLDEPTTYHFGVADTLSACGFPQIEVATVEGRFGEWAVDRVEADHDQTVNVVCWLQGDSGQVAPVYEQLLGMARCIIEVLKAENAFGDGAELANENGIYWRVTEAIPLEADDANREVKRWMVPVFVQFRIETVERFV